jgi:hypothetical protein
LLRDVRYEHDGDVAAEHEVELFGARAVGVPLVVSRVVLVVSRCRSSCRRIMDADVPRRSLLISPWVPWPGAGRGGTRRSAPTWFDRPGEPAAVGDNRRREGLHQITQRAGLRDPGRSVRPGRGRGRARHRGGATSSRVRREPGGWRPAGADQRRSCGCHARMPWAPARHRRRRPRRPAATSSPAGSSTWVP